MLTLNVITYAQTTIDSLYGTIVNGENSKAIELIERIEKNSILMNEKTKSDYLYLKGIYLE